MSTMKIVLAAAVAAGAAMTAAADDTPAARAFALRMEGKSDQAKALLDAALEENAKDAKAWFELARTEIYHMQMDDATAAIDRAIELQPRNARYHALRGLIAGYNVIVKSHEGDPGGEMPSLMRASTESFMRAAELDPENLEVRVLVVNGLVESPWPEPGDEEAARKETEAIEALDPVFGAEARALLVPSDERIALWERVVAAHPDRADAQAGLALAYQQTNEVDKAAEHYEAALALDPSRTDLLLDLGRNFGFADRFDEAEQAFSRYVATDPPAPLRASGTFYVAVITKRRGETERADALLAEARKIDPHVWTTVMEPPKQIFDEP